MLLSIYCFDIYLLDFFYSGIQLYLLLSPYPFNTYISFSYLGMYVLRDDAPISYEFFMQIKVSKGTKIGNRYNQVPHLTQDTNGKVTNSQ